MSTLSSASSSMSSGSAASESVSSAGASVSVDRRGAAFYFTCSRASAKCCGWTGPFSPVRGGASGATGYSTGETKGLE